MATTTNFGWTTPDDSALVKDGASAIRTLGSSIDSSMGDLKGGTTGQVLAKASNADMDFTWSSDQVGIPASIVDAKGDIIAATAADTVSRLAVGANDTVLTADSTAATGLKWATAAAGGMTLLSTTTLSGTSTTISSINQTYNTLYGILTNATWASGTNGLWCAPNNDTGGTVQVYWSAAGGVTALNLSYFRLTGQSIDSDSNAIAFQIENYAQSTKKPMRAWGGGVIAGNYGQQSTNAMFQSNTAITSLVFTNSGGVSFTGGTIKLYGVK